jgi:RHS repeat-associated protein
MLDNLDLIHMNGRVQDPVLGRFISADPYITEPLQTQNYNRYSYVYNRPLSYADPTGFGVKCIFREIQRRTTTDSSVETEDGTTFQNGATTSLTFAGYVLEGEWTQDRSGGGGGGGSGNPTPDPCAGEQTTELTQAQVDALNKAFEKAIKNADPKKVTPQQLRNRLNQIANGIVGAHQNLVPEAPSNQSYTTNVANGDAHRSIAGSGNYLVPNTWFYNMVRNRGPWDFKNNSGKQYEAAGNFNFGAVGYAVYREGRFPLVGAGWAQTRAGTGMPQWGSPGSYPVSTKDASGFFGDDPKDQFWATQGVQFGQLVLGECKKQ